MDLTLEKILLYLEDRLPPAEVKELARFLQQHPEAQSLLHRVEKHLRIRSEGADEELPEAQLVAAYLDGVLSKEAVADLERKTLQDDNLLHELAASHFCNASIPEGKSGEAWARHEGIDWDRMLHLVKGAKDRPRKKPKEDQPLGRVRKSQSSIRVSKKHVLIGVGALALLLVAITGLMLRQRPNTKKETLAQNQVENVGEKGLVKNPNGELPEPEKGGAGLVREEEGQGKNLAGGPPVGAGNPLPMPMPMVMPPVEPAKPPMVGMIPPAVAPENDANKQMPVIPEADLVSRVDVGRVVSNRQVLLRREEEGTPWRRVADGGPLRSQDQLMALPGYTVEARMDRGPSLILWGNLPEASNNPVVQEAEIRLLPPGKGVHGELELIEGRVYLKGGEGGPVLWRLRFKDQVWDVVIDKPGHEVMAEVVAVGGGKAAWRDGEEVAREMTVAPVIGGAVVSTVPGVKMELQAPPGKKVFLVFNTTRGVVDGPLPLEREEVLWTRAWRGNPDTQAAFKAACLELEKDLTPERIPSVGMDLALNGKFATPALRHLAIFALGCMGDHVRMLSEMSDETLTEDRRLAAAGSLRHWVGEEAKRGLFLFNPRTDSGYLVEKLRFTPSDAGLLVDLLEPASIEEVLDKRNLMAVAELLQHEQLTIRVAAHRYLLDLAENPNEGKSLVRFDSRALPVARRTATQQWQKLIQEGKYPAMRRPATEVKPKPPTAKPNDKKAEPKPADPPK